VVLRLQEQQAQPSRSISSISISRTCWAALFCRVGTAQAMWLAALLTALALAHGRAGLAALLATRWLMQLAWLVTTCLLEMRLALGLGMSSSSSSQV
jgi:small-conductance mechanosensitive channel